MCEHKLFFGTFKQTHTNDTYRHMYIFEGRFVYFFYIYRNITGVYLHTYIHTRMYDNAYIYVRTHAFAHSFAISFIHSFILPVLSETTTKII